MLSASQVLDYLIVGPGEGVVSLFPVVQGGVQRRLVGTGRLVALVARALPQAGLPLLCPGDLADGAPIAFEPDSVHGQAMSRHLTDGPGPIVPRRTHLVRFAEIAVGFAEAGLGIALVDEFSALSADAGRAVAVPTWGEPDSAFRTYLHCNVARALSRPMRLQEEELSEELFDGHARWDEAIKVGRPG